MTIKAQIEVVGLGQCSLDILGQLESYPKLDQKAELSSLLLQGGGPVATALVTLARLGVSVAMFGAVGDDHFGQEIQDDLIAEGVDCTFLTKDSGCTSQAAFIAVDDQGHRNIFWHRGNAVPDVTALYEALLSRAVKVLHLDGLHLMPAIAAAKIARSLNVVTVLDAGTMRPGLERLLPLIDHLVVSENFSGQIFGRHDPEAALRFLAGYGAAGVTITCGESGSMSIDKTGSVFYQQAFAIDVVDTTGCGDVFHGGYIYGLLQGWEIRQTVRFAAACAALKTRALGGRTAIPDLPSVEAFLRTGCACT
ncbi:MAG: PfkB family carbohydrate kinase [Desulfuromonadales bacterium]